MAKLTYKKRVWIVKKYLDGMSATKIAKSQNINRRCVYQLIDKHKEDGWDGLKDHKTGRPETVLNAKAEAMILAMRKKYGYGACRIEETLKRDGFGISHRQIDKLLVRNGLVKPNIKKQKPRKWVRYELPNPNDLWHTDWTYDPFTTRNLLVYLDDRTRLITSYVLNKKATTELSLGALKVGIAEYGKPKAVMTDHGTQFYNNTPDKRKKINLGEYQRTLRLLNIKHYLARVNRPQTNGKVERWFKTYKTEYIQETFSNIKDFIKYYNTERLHMSLNNKTPLEVWNELKSV
jgi:putative transposase